MGQSLMSVTVHLDEELRLDSATRFMLVRRSSSTADGIYFINEDRGGGVEPSLGGNILK